MNKGGIYDVGGGDNTENRGVGKYFSKGNISMNGENISMNRGGNIINGREKTVNERGNIVETETKRVEIEIL